MIFTQPQTQSCGLPQPLLTLTGFLIVFGYPVCLRHQGFKQHRTSKLPAYVQRFIPMPKKSKRTSQRARKPVGGRTNNVPRDQRTEQNVVVYKPPSMPRSITHVFRRTAAPVTLTNSTVTEFLYAFNFMLSYLPSYTEFTALYDQYQIAQVEVRFVPTAVTATALDQMQGFTALAVDYDDSVTPANIDTLLQYGSCAVFSPTKEIMFRLRPRAALAAYSGAFTSYANLGNMWIDVGSPSVQHYGLKVGMSASTPVHSYVVVPTYTLRFRSSR